MCKIQYSGTALSNETLQSIENVGEIVLALLVVGTKAVKLEQNV